MAFNFKESLKKVADAAIGTEITKDFGKSKEQFQAYESFPEYNAMEPAQWTGTQGEERVFTIAGNNIRVSANLDTCMEYYPRFLECAKYYTERFRFKYANCIKDFDSFVHYFKDVYMEGFLSMTQRAYSLLLPLGIYDMEYDEFQKIHLDNYHAAVDVYEATVDVQRKKAQSTFQIAGMVNDRNSIDMVSASSASGLRKAQTKADLQNLKTTLITTAMASWMSKLSPAQKAEAWEKVESSDLFQRVYFDYLNTFFTLLQSLSERGIFGTVSVAVRKETMVVYNNLKNPMFPEAQFLPTITKIIAENPFVPEFYELLEAKIGATDEVRAVKQYFIR